MQVIKPTTFDRTVHLFSSTASEIYSNWGSGTTYALNAYVRREPNIYISLTANNIANDPLTSPTRWALVGPDNKHSMFDGTVSTATTASNSLTVVLRPGLCNSLALFGLVGTSLTVSVKDTFQAGGTVIYSKTFNLNATEIYNWYDYFFQPYVQISEVVLTDLPPYSTAEITITITGGSVEIGSAVWGSVYSLGTTESGVGLGIIDYSVKETDEFGTTTFVERDFSKRVSARIFLPNNQLNRVQRILSSLRATPCVWIPTQDPNLIPLIVFGFYKDFNIEIPYPQYSYCSLEIEGLT